MAKTKEIAQVESTNVLGFIIANPEKWNRAVFGTVASLGQLTGGVGENASDEEKLAEYDRLGGLILKGKYKVKTGSFWDFKKKVAHAKPEVVFLFRDLAGDEVEVAEDEEIPLEVRAAEVASENAKKKATVSKKKKKIVDEDEE